MKEVQNLGSIVFSAYLVQSLIDWLLPQVLPELAEAIGTVPVPSYECYGQHARDIWRADDIGAWAGNHPDEW